MSIALAAATFGLTALAVGLAVAISWFLRRKMRAQFPGGPGRFVRALILQATAFIAPFPLAAALSPPDLPQPWPFVAASVVAYATLVLLRHLPATKGLINDLARVRLKAALESLPPEAPETKR